jgi:hypothetical protein
MDYGSTWDPREVIMILGHDGVCYPPESGRDATTDGDIFGSGVQDRPGTRAGRWLSYREGCCTFDQGVTGHSQELRKTAQHSIA